MKNKKRTITATEVNKFTHCPYQWYYERYYGNQYPHQLKKDRDKSFLKKTENKDPFKKGKEFHENYYRKDRLKKLKKRRRILAGVFAVIFTLICVIVFVTLAYFLFSFINFI